MVLGLCQLQSCTQPAQCSSGVCDPAAFRCRCESASQCPLTSDSCQVLQSACMDECVDGRCLGTCELGLGGG